MKRLILATLVCLLFMIASAFLMFATMLPHGDVF